MAREYVVGDAFTCTNKLVLNERKPFQYTELTPMPTKHEMHVARAQLKALREQHAPWRKALGVPVGRLVELYLSREAMWGVAFKGKTVLKEYDTTTEAWAEANATKTSKGTDK